MRSSIVRGRQARDGDTLTYRNGPGATIWPRMDVLAAQDWAGRGDLNRFHGLLFHMQTGVCICSRCGTIITRMVTPTAYTNGSQAFESQVPCTH